MLESTNKTGINSTYKPTGYGTIEGIGTVRVPRFKIFDEGYLHKILTPLPDAPKAPRPDLNRKQNLLRAILYSPITHSALNFITSISQYLPIPGYVHLGLILLTNIIS